MAEQVNQTDERAEFIRGLRELADYMEAEPEAPLPSVHSRGACRFASTRAELEDAARIFGDAARESANDYSVLIFREFSGSVRLEVSVSLSSLGIRVPPRPSYRPILPEKAEVGS